MKHIKIFEEFGKELNNSEYEYNFSQDGVDYIVNLYKKSNTSFSVGYGILDEDDVKYSTLNKDNIFQVINKVTSCIKDFVSKHPDVNSIEFFGMPDNKLDWMLKLVGKDVYINWIVENLFNLLTKVIPTKRINVFQRWAEREGGKMNWSVRRIGNKIVMKKI